MSAAVEYVGDQTFVFALYNHTTQSYTETALTQAEAPVPLRNTAEWVIEAFTYLAKFSPINFTHCFAVINGWANPINSPAWQTQAIQLTSKKSPDLRAVPSPFNETGDGFTMTWLKES